MNYAGFGMLLLYVYDLASQAIGPGECDESRESIDIAGADAASGRVSVVVKGPWGQAQHEVGP